MSKQWSVDFRTPYSDATVFMWITARKVERKDDYTVVADGIEIQFQNGCYVEAVEK